ncbi:hypothetical protein MASR1M29_20020 [Cloacibacterium normanense]
MNRRILLKPNENNLSYTLLVFLFSPLLALIISLKNYKEVWAKNIVLIFSGFYGFMFVIGNAGSDINRYKSRFEENLNLDISLLDYLKLLFKEDKFDFIQPFLSYFVSCFTSDFRVFLLLIGLIFGFFLSRNIWYVISLVNNKPRWFSILFILVFSFIYAIWDINVMRFTLAAHIFFYGVFNVMVRKNNWGYLFALISIFMHFSFMIALVLFILYKLLGSNFVKIYFVLFIFSFLTSELNLSVVKEQMSILPQNLIEKSDDYLNEDYKEKREELNSNKNFRGKYYQSSLKWSVGILLTFIYFKRNKETKKQTNKDTVKNLLGFCLLFLGVFNILSNIPSMNRFQFLSYLFAFALFYIYFSKLTQKNEIRIVYLVLPLILFYFIVKLRIGLEFTGIFTLLGGPVTAFFSDNDVPLIDFLK